MERLFEFLFSARGRMNRAPYWRSLLVFSVAGLFVGITLFTAAGLAAPLFMVASIVILLPWLMWGFGIHAERLHDRDKSAWWLLLFYAAPGVLGHLAQTAWPDGTPGAALQYVFGSVAFGLSIWGFIEIGCLRGTAGPNRYGSDPLARSTALRVARTR